jgi:two-component system LytT family response regulator
MQLNIIVIDDSPMQLLMSSKLIQQNGRLNLLGAFTNPFLGLRAVNTMDVDIVLLDVEMPEIDGFSLKKMFNNQVKVIMNSTRSIFEFRAYSQGAVDFINKPLNAKRLDSSISKISQKITFFGNQEKERTAIAS